MPESPRARPDELKTAEFAFTTWRHHPAFGITKEHLLEPSYWAVVSRQFRPGDEIQAFAQDGTYYATFLVLASDKTYAKVHLLSYHSLTTTDVSESQAAAFEVRWKGPKLKHCVIRKADGAIIHEGAQTLDDASQWLKERELQLIA